MQLISQEQLMKINYTATLYFHNSPMLTYSQQWWPSCSFMCNLGFISAAPSEKAFVFFIWSYVKLCTAKKKEIKPHFFQDLPMFSPIQFGLHQISSFWKEGICNISHIHAYKIYVKQCSAVVIILSRGLQ